MEALLVLFVLFVVLHNWLERRRKERYLSDKFLTRQEYMQKYGYSNRSLSCHQCGGRRIRNWGVQGRSDAHRLHICNDCETVLYRSERSTAG